MENKKTKGKQKIEMKKIENENNRQITFSKRRQGICKKANELVTLTGAEIAFVTFSPAGKPYSFGHPSFESVIARFTGRDATENENTNLLVEAYRKAKIDELTNQYNTLLEQLEIEKDKEHELKKLIKENNLSGWWDVDIDKLNPEELPKLEEAFKEVYSNLCKKMEEKNRVPSTSNAPLDADNSQ